MIRLSPALPLKLRRPARDALTPAFSAPLMPERAADPALGDWHDLFCAVTDRLRRNVGAAEVQECVAALDQLSATLKDEIGRSQRQGFEAQTALAQALDALAGSGEEQPYARYLAGHDSLTAPPDRRIFSQCLEQALLQLAPGQHGLAVLYLGLEGFKAIVDRHGQGLADELLWAVTARLMRAVRDEDLVCHFGQDEWACLLVDVPGREPLSRLACKLFDALAAPFLIGAHPFCIRPSIGIATSDGDSLSAAALLSRADAAMVRARRFELGHAFDGERSAEPAQQALLL